MVDAALIGDPVPSPCINVCQLDAQGLCVGCRRTIEEITEWPRASEARRREILSELEGRKACPPAPLDGARSPRD
jgi:predicted Fe-S protein YdhL (DUF1289 family)